MSYRVKTHAVRVAEAAKEIGLETTSLRRGTVLITNKKDFALVIPAGPGSCYISEVQGDQEGALRIVRMLIQARGWQVVDIDKNQIVNSLAVAS